MPALDSDLIQSVIEHMNEDHGSAVLVYVQAYAGRVAAESAKLVDLDSESMQIRYLEAGLKTEIRVPFERPVLTAGEIRVELTRMAKEGRKRLQI